MERNYIEVCSKLCSKATQVSGKELNLCSTVTRVSGLSRLLIAIFLQADGKVPKGFENFFPKDSKGPATSDKPKPSEGSEPKASTASRYVIFTSFFLNIFIRTLKRVHSPRPAPHHGFIQYNTNT